jgi:response regulator RpfG family c-di-GMP phosphodiesterase
MYISVLSVSVVVFFDAAKIAGICNSKDDLLHALLWKQKTDVSDAARAREIIFFISTISKENRKNRNGGHCARLVQQNRTIADFLFLSKKNHTLRQATC